MLNSELTRAIENNTISHAYLFLNEVMALEFINALGVRAADFIVQEQLLTKDIDELQAQLKFKPFGDRRVVLIKHADNMQPVVQNKLLKTLEEPQGNTVIILSAQRRDALLQTILSRCTEIAALDETPEIDLDALKIAKAFYASEPSFHKRKEIISEIEDRELASKFLDALENLMREELIKTLDSSTLGPKIKLTEEARKNIKSGFSVSYALKALALNM